MSTESPSRTGDPALPTPTQTRDPASTLSPTCSFRVRVCTDAYGSPQLPLGASVPPASPANTSDPYSEPTAWGWPPKEMNSGVS